MPGQIDWIKNDGTIPLTLQVQFDGIPVSGLLPTVEVVRFPDNFVADWANFEFRGPEAAASGQGVMAPLPSGTGDLYIREFNPALFGEQAGRQIYVTRYRATIPSGFRQGVDKDISVSTHQLVTFRPLSSGVLAINQALGATFCEV